MLAFLVGAGISCEPPAGLPLAGDLKRQILEGLWRRSAITRQRFALKSIDAWISRLRFETLMQLLVDTAGQTRFLRLFRSGRPNAFHEALARALVDGCPVLTTNFDTLIERASAKRGTATVIVDSRGFRARPGRWAARGVLAKLHGSIDLEASIRATLLDIGRLGPAFMWDPPRGKFLAQVRRNFPLAILGYSGGDDADVMPRLEITVSSQPLLWVHHDPSISPPKIFEPRRQGLSTVPAGVWEFLVKQEALVAIGSTREVLALIEQRAMAPTDRRTISRRWDEHVLRSLGRSRDRWLGDFLLGRVAYEVGARAESREIFRRVARATMRARHPVVAARAMVNDAVVASDFGDWQHARTSLEAALPILKTRADARAWANAAIDHAVALQRLGQKHDAATRYAELLARVRQVPDLERERGRAAANLAGLFFETGQYRAARGAIREALMAYRACGDHAGLAVVYGTHGKILYVEGHAEAAERAFEMALWHARAGSDVAGQARLLNSLAAVWRRAGQISRAEEIYGQARRLAVSVGDVDSRVVADMGLVTVCLAKGEPGRAERLARRCLREAERIGLLDHAAQTRGNLALAWLDAGRARVALGLFRAALGQFRALGLRREVAFTLRNIAECLLKTGHTREARRVIAEAVDEFRHLGLVDDMKEAEGLAGHSGPDPGAS